MSEIIANRYLVASELGHGGMADVYLAIDTVLNREVAIKVLRGDLSTDPVALLRFQREANAASTLNHPNIVEIYDVGEYDNKPYIVMEYVRGKTLKQLVFQRGALSPKEASTIMKQLISAVSLAHQNGIIHRDIKPQNVLIKDDGTAKITDFGIAQTQDAIQLTQTDNVLGSVHYLAPEIARGEPASEQSDVYSLGIVFYELLTGNVPYNGETPIQIAMKHMEQNVPSVRLFDSSIPQSIDNIVTKATSKNKNYRYLTAGDMLKDLETAFDPKRLNEKKLTIGEDKNGTTLILPKVSGVGDEKKDKKGIAQVILLSITGLIAILLLITLIWLISSSSGPKIIPMIDLSDKTVEEATVLLEQEGLSIGKITYKVTDDIEKGKIVSTLPLANSDVEKGTAVTLTVSDGIYFVVGDYVGYPVEDVKAILSDQNILVHTEKETGSDYPVGTVIRQESLNPGDKCSPNIKYTINLIVADYDSFVIPANIIGMDVYNAQNYLQEKGARVVLYPLSREDVSAEELERCGFNRVVGYSPENSFYTQKEDNYITLYYY